MAPTYLDHLTHFTNFLTAYTHTLLYLRSLYPRPTFLTSKFHNTPVYQSRHPAVCAWISDAISAVRNELLLGTVARIAIVIYHVPEKGPGTGSAKVLERYMFDVSSFPVVSKGERNLEIEWEDDDEEEENELQREREQEEQNRGGKGKGKQRVKPLDEGVDVDISEQFRAALVTLTTRCSQLKSLPGDCSFNISLELKDEADIDPPVGHPQPWIPVQPSLQKTGRKGAQAPSSEGDGGDDKGEGRNREGEDLGGVRTTPIRSVEAGVFRFETWVEEAKAKFEVESTPKSSFMSSGG
ncbi:DNA-binding protein [Zopfia rhizophila CBS 207.26]|uniref:DNA-binding protein n=1 Tax=Zopfia rhizophila CBS 207.26 TaxID=1314779 RepID=A0A6A6EEU2_9PEZI|nr:DNA-binding protein [Zopfia rhizophila CBS 207.26]